MCIYCNTLRIYASISQIYQQLRRLKFYNKKVKVLQIVLQMNALCILCKNRCKLHSWAFPHLMRTFKQGFLSPINFAKFTFSEMLCLRFLLSLSFPAIGCPNRKCSRDIQTETNWFLGQSAVCYAWQSPCLSAQTPQKD